jgi:chemotaxis family two-component system response regulator Rcp1
MFRILIVDDDPAAAHLLKEVMKPLLNRAELHFVSDGVEALDFLHQRGAYPQAPRPNLILLDINMPRLGGLETLSAIKSDPELYIIPVIMLSASSHPGDVRKSYQALANCYMQKPADLDRSMKLAQAIEAFWMDFALQPAPDSRPASPALFGALLGGFGRPIAPTNNEGNHRAMQYSSPESRAAAQVRKSGCGEHNRLLNEFGTAVRGLLNLHEQQFLAIVEEDSECTRFDLLIHMANEKKQHAKYAYLRHLEAHGCSNEHDIEQART